MGDQAQLLPARVEKLEAGEVRVREADGGVEHSLMDRAILGSLDALDHDRRETVDAAGFAANAVEIQVDVSRENSRAASVRKRDVPRNAFRSGVEHVDDDGFDDGPSVAPDLRRGPAERRGMPAAEKRRRSLVVKRAIGDSPGPAPWVFPGAPVTAANALIATPGRESDDVAARAPARSSGQQGGNAESSDAWLKLDSV